ncbi:hypothetical protein ACFFRR_005489 [Megaselia abdita]
MATGTSIEEMYKAQEELGNDIVKFYVNYSKLPSADRKNISIVNKKITSICELVNKFNENHEVIVTSGGNESDLYFTSNYKDTINHHHESHLDKILADKTTIENSIPPVPKGILPLKFQQSLFHLELPVTTPTDQATLSAKYEITKLMKHQLTAISILEDKIHKVEARMETLIGPRIEIIVEDLHFQWNKITDLHRKILLQKTSGFNEDVDYDVDIYSSLEDKVEERISQLILRKREEEGNNSLSTTTMESRQVHEPFTRQRA